MYMFICLLFICEYNVYVIWYFLSIICFYVYVKFMYMDVLYGFNIFDLKNEYERIFLMVCCIVLVI